MRNPAATRAAIAKAHGRKPVKTAPVAKGLPAPPPPATKAAPRPARSRPRRRSPRRLAPCPPGSGRPEYEGGGARDREGDESDRSGDGHGNGSRPSGPEGRRHDATTAKTVAKVTAGGAVATKAAQVTPIENGAEQGSECEQGREEARGGGPAAVRRSGRVPVQRARPARSLSAAVEGEYVGMDVGGDAPPDVGGLKVVGIVWGATDRFAMVRGHHGQQQRPAPAVTRCMNGFVEGLKRDGSHREHHRRRTDSVGDDPLTRKGDQTNANR